MPDPPKPFRSFWESRTGQKIVRLLEPSKWWIVIFLFGIVAVNVWALTISRAQTRDEAAHASEIVANADAQYVACIKSIPFLTKVNGLIAGDRVIRNAVVSNSRANHLADPTSKIKARNYNRLKKARAKAYQVEFPVPTIHPKKHPDGTSCDELRARLLKAD